MPTDGTYISGVNLTSDLKYEDIYDMLSCDTFVELGEEMVKGTYLYNEDFVNSDGKKYSNTSIELAPDKMIKISSNIDETGTSYTYHFNSDGYLEYIDITWMYL